MKTKITFLLCAWALVLAGACEDPYKGVAFTLTDEQPIGTWLAEQEEFSLWVEMLQKADIFNAINLGATDYTCFVANNGAVKTWLQEKGYAKVADIPAADLDFLMRYHVIAGNALKASDMMLKIPNATVSGDYLTAGVDTQTEIRYIDNGNRPRSQIIVKDRVMSNGIIQEVDRPLEPIVETLWDLISGDADGRYSIFAGAVAAAGMDSFLHRSNVATEELTYKENKTVFAVSDSIYGLYGIESLEDLMACFDGADPAQEDSDFGQYVRYHIMYNLNSYAELTTFQEDLKAMILYPLASRKGIAFLDSANVVWINPQEEKITILEGHRDIPAQNGYLHEVTGPMFLPQRMPHYLVVWEVTDSPLFHHIPFYRSEKTTSASAERYDMEPEDLPFVEWSSVPKTAAKVWYHSQNVGNRYWNSDALYWSLGSIGTLAFNTPVLPMGKYQLHCEKLNDGTNGGKFHVDFDTDRIHDDANFKNGSTRASWGGSRNFRSEERHVIRFTAGSAAGWGGVDRFIFAPVD